MSKVLFELQGGEETPLTLQQAILVYRGDKAFFASAHTVDHSGKRPMIKEGQAFTPEAAVELALALSRNAMTGGFVPYNLLYLDGNAMAWWVPPSRRHIRFQAEELGAAERGEVVPHPGLVFRVHSSRQWQVWALKGPERPTEKTSLCRAPYFNVSDTGMICAGNVQLPEGTTAERIEAWNTAFFGSYFTHPNATGKLVNYRGGLFKFWTDMLDGRHSAFPDHALTSAGITLEQALVGRKARV